MPRNHVPEANLEGLKAWFNENQDKPRLVALMSPTCGFCLIGHQAVRTYNAWLEGEDFVTKRVWVPMMALDGIQAAEVQAASGRGRERRHVAPARLKAD